MNHEPSTMNIDRHNYEAFFLLYVDNELSAADRKAVDVFVQQNPDLYKELLMLQQSILPGDEIVFETKNELLKETGFVELQEKLLLFADDELPAAETQAIKTLLVTDTAAAAEWNMLQQTKLQPDNSIVFADKDFLYRTAGRSVVAFKWWRAAAAAILLGIGIWTVVAIYKNNTKITDPGQGIAKGDKNQTPSTPVNKAENSVVGKQQTNTPVVQQTITVGNPQKKSPSTRIEKNNQVPEKTVKQNTVLQKENIALSNENDNNKKPTNNLPRPLENINSNSSNKNSTANVQSLIPEQNNAIARNDIKKNKTEQPAILIPTVPVNNVVEPVNVYAKNAVYDGNAAEKNDTRILYMDEEKVRHTRLGGFLRKVKRVIERNTNVKTGNGIKLAGFEIAVK